MVLCYSVFCQSLRVLTSLKIFLRVILLDFFTQRLPASSNYPLSFVAVHETSTEWPRFYDADSYIPWAHLSSQSIRESFHAVLCDTISTGSGNWKLSCWIYTESIALIYRSIQGLAKLSNMKILVSSLKSHWQFLECADFRIKTSINLFTPERSPFD